MRATFAIAVVTAVLAGCSPVDDGSKQTATWTAKYNVAYSALSNCIAEHYAADVTVVPQQFPAQRRSVVLLTQSPANKVLAEFDVRQTNDTSSTVTYRRIAGVSSLDDRKAKGHADACASNDYMSLVFRHIHPYRVYPVEARDTQQHGRVVTRVTINRAGGLVNLKIENSSGSSLIDNAEMDAIRRAMPLPPVPAGLPGDPVVLVLPMNY